MVRLQYPCQGQEGPWDKPPDPWRRQADLCLPTTPVSGLRGRHLEPITQPGQGGTWVDGGHLTTVKGPLTQEGAQGSSSSCPAPHRKRCHGDREGGFGCTAAGMLGMCLLLVLLCWAGTAWPQPFLFSSWGQVWGRRGETGELLHRQDTLLPIGTKATP